MSLEKWSSLTPQFQLAAVLALADVNESLNVDDRAVLDHAWRALGGDDSERKIMLAVADSANKLSSVTAATIAIERGTANVFDVLVDSIQASTDSRYQHALFDELSSLSTTSSDLNRVVLLHNITARLSK